MPHTEFNGNAIELGRVLGMLITGQNRQTEVLEEIRDHLSSKTASTPTMGLAHMKEFLQELYPVLKVTLALVFLFGLITKQVTWADLPGIAAIAIGH